MSTDPYLVARVEQALATDSRTGELDVHVKVVADRLFISGSVASDARRDAVTKVAMEHAGGLPVVNEVSVLRDEETTEMEELR